ncbi:acyl-CoA desaturase [Chitinophaga sedimenti]|uniref:fatty acid desaturase family protein n=1 Tax=Chitinophaga sedimenti TaxID=2033606 RepID=UPI002006C8AC|nr:acyl-CoA desaturase [Chitinophaga sedimenti]MCK7553636.1 acyl-CoA desaturase [Chitinophaga sedimenti]
MNTRKKKEIVRFASKETNLFADRVKAKVDEYFSNHKLSRYANTGMWIKTTCMILLYILPYLTMTLGYTADSVWLFPGMWAMMGLGVIGIGTSVMHDANHGTYSSRKNVNTAMSHILKMIGGYTVTWKIQHNLLHHTYTNLTGLDEDITPTTFLRFSPGTERKPYHKLQFIYAWGLYAMMTLFWMTGKDFRQLFRYERHQLLVKQKTTLPAAMTFLSLLKMFYFGYIIVLPLLFSGMSWWMVVLGFVVMHVIAGLSLACIFQLAHIMESSTFAEPVTDAMGKKQMENNWAVHQLLNTSNYCPKNKLLTWFIGGLNYQIEHHLFPNICHVHYSRLSPIISSTAREFGLPYHVQPNLFKALQSHTKMLWILGRK